MKPTEVGDETRGYDSGKKIAVRKRHITVDTLGLLVAAVVHGANWQDQDSAHFAFMTLKNPFGDLVDGKNELSEWAKAQCGCITVTCERQGIHRAAQTLESLMDLRLDQPAPSPLQGLRKNYLIQ